MITLSDQIKLANILPLDPRLSNVSLSGSNIIIETINEYLARVPEENRYLGMEIYILSPAGTYEINSFINLVNTEQITFVKYHFETGIADADILQMLNLVIDNLDSTSTVDALSANQGRVLKKMMSSFVSVETDPVFTAWINSTPPAYPGDIPTTLAELTDDIDHRTVNDSQIDYWNNKSDSTHLHIGVYEPANANIQTHISSQSNPHNVTKSQVGLGNVDNTSDANKPISSATQTALNAKADKVTGATANNFAALDTNGNLKDSGNKASDFDLAGAASTVQGNLTTHINDTNNPHSVTKTQVGLGNVPNVDATVASNITQDSTHRFVSDTEKSTWNSKQDALGYTPEDITNKVISFQVTPDDIHYPSEKLVKDSLDGKQPIGNYSTDIHTNITALNAVSGVNTGDQDLSGYSLTSHNHDGVYAPVLGPDDNYVTDAEKLALHTHSNKTALDNVSGVNTGDNSPNSLYSGLATSKQDTLVSGTNIKTINGQTVLGSGDISIAEAGGDVVGPASAIDGNVAVFNGTSGKIIKDSGITISGTNTGDETQSTILSKLGFTPENVANRRSTFQVTPDDTHYPTEKLVKDSLDSKVDKVAGKGLSTNDLTDTLKTNYDTAYTNTHTHSNKTALDAVSGTNTGDNATNTTSNSYADGKVEDTIVNGVTTKAPSQNAVYDALALKQDTLQSGVNIKTINNESLVGSGNITIQGAGGDVAGPASSADGDIVLFNGTTGKLIKDSSKTIVTTLGSTDTTVPTSKAVKDVTDTKVTGNAAITGATKTKITYDSKGLVTDGADATTADIADSLNKRYVTDAQLTVIGNTSGTNTGDETQSSIITKIGYTPENVSNKSTNTSLGSSDTLYPSQNAVKTYVDTKVGNAIRYQGDWDASGGTYPTTGGSGTAGAIMKGDMFIISVAGTLGGVDIQIGDEIIAKINTPGQTSSNWTTLNTNISYVPENVANKVTSISGSSTDTQYPSAKLVYDQLATKQPTGSYEVTTNKENTTLDTSTTKYPTNNLVKTYVDAGDKRISTGCLTNPTFTDNGNGTATISSVQVNIFPTSDFSGNMLTFTVPQATLSFTDGTEEYISVRYNAGSPIYYKETVGATMNHSDILPIFVIWRLGTVVHSLNFDSLGVGLANKTQSAAYHTKLYEISSDGGLVISESALPNPRTIAVTSAIVYTGVIHQDVAEFNSSTDQMTQVAHVGGVWTYTDQLVYNNLYYDNGTNLVNINNNKYAVRWYYRSVGDTKQLFYVNGTAGNYNSIAEASYEKPRTDLPIILKHHCVLIGRSIIQYNATNGYTESLIGESYTFAGVINHDDTANKSLAGTGVTWGHINDQAQTIYGVKTFNSSSIIPTLPLSTNTTQAANTAFVMNQINSYVGSTNITTLGTVTTGTWNADTISISKGGTGLTSLGLANQLLRVNAGATALEYFTPTWTSNTGTVTSVAMTVPTGLSISGTPITTSGTLALTLTTGYSIPTTASQANWDSAYTDRMKWDGGSTGLVAATGRTSLGATTVGSNLFTLTNPSAITFLRVNADNTVSALDAATFRSAIGATTGTVTSVAMTVPTGLSISGTPITTSGTLALTMDTGYSIPTNTNQTNWSTAYTYSQVGHLPLSGGTMSNSNLVNNLNAQYLGGNSSAYYQQALVSGTNIKTINNTSLLGSGNIQIDSGTPVITVTQNGHGFSIGNIIRVSGANTFTKAQANSTVNSEVVGYITEIVDINTFKYITGGYVTTGVPTATAGTVYYLDPSTAGSVTATEPSSVGQVSKPLLIIIESGTKAAFFNFRGMELNSIPTTIAGEIWTSLSGTYASTTTFTFSGDDKMTKLIQLSLFTCTDSTGATRRVGYVKSAINNTGTVTVTVVTNSDLASGDKDFKVTYNRKILDYKHDVKIPGECIADTSYSQGWWHQDIEVDSYLLPVDTSVLTAAAGTGAALTYNVYKNTTALFSAAPDMTTNTVLRAQRPTTNTISAGDNVSLRIMSSAGATNKAADFQAKLFIVPQAIFTAF